MTILMEGKNRISDVADRLNSNSKTTVSNINYVREKLDELMFLESFFGFLPATDRHIRTQKAILEEVQSLRSKISNKLKGSLHVLVDTKANKLYLKEGMTLLWEADCSAGRGGMLTDKKTGRRWEFVTPKGKFKVLSKLENPIWIKPDWAFVETGEIPPPPGDPLRNVTGELGAYVLNLGDGYLIHGTKNEEALGRPVSHGCVRLGAESLKQLYEKVPNGTEVYIY